MSSHNEKIKCPECSTIQITIVQEFWPWDNYTHHCENCGYIIMESEWDRVQEITEDQEPENYHGE